MERYYIDFSGWIPIEAEEKEEAVQIFWDIIDELNERFNDYEEKFHISITDVEKEGE